MEILWIGSSRLRTVDCGCDNMVRACGRDGLWWAAHENVAPLSHAGPEKSSGQVRWTREPVCRSMLQKSKRSSIAKQIVGNGADSGRKAMQTVPLG